MFKRARLGELLLLTPALLLALIFRSSRHFLVADDIWYWDLSLRWNEIFSKSPIFTALKVIYDYPNGRTSIHPLIGAFFLWPAQHSIATATVLIGLSFSLLLGWSLFRVFRAFELPQKDAILGALLVGTWPVLLAHGRFFMMEFPFATFSVTALAFLLSDRLKLFALFYALSLMERPVEGTALLLGYLLLWIGKKNSLRVWPILRAAAFGFLLAIACLKSRLAGLYLWFRIGTFPVGRGGDFAERVHFGLQNLFFPWEKLFLVFGFTGIVLVIVSFWNAGKGNKAEHRAHWGIFAFMITVLTFNGMVDAPGSRDAFFRYSLCFMLFFFISACVWLLRSRSAWVRGAVSAAFFSANIAVIANFSVLGIFHTFERTSPSFLYNFALIQSINNPGRVPSLFAQLEAILPDSPARILLVGRDPLFFSEWGELNLRAREAKREWQFTNVFSPLYRSYVKHRMGKRQIEWSRLKVDYVLFCPGSVYPPTNPFPSPELFGVLEKNLPGEANLKLIGRMKAEVPGSSQELLVFATNAQRF